MQSPPAGLSTRRALPGLWQDVARERLAHGGLDGRALHRSHWENR